VPKRDEVTGEWRQLCNKELYDLYSSPNIQVIKSQRMRWVGHVARMGRRGAYRVNLREKDRFEHLGICGRIILKGSSRIRMGCDMDWIDLA